MRHARVVPLAIGLVLLAACGQNSRSAREAVKASRSPATASTPACVDQAAVTADLQTETTDMEGASRSFSRMDAGSAVALLREGSSASQKALTAVQPFLPAAEAVLWQDSIDALNRAADLAEQGDIATATTDIDEATQFLNDMTAGVSGSIPTC